jgi:hypothetical protein
MSKFKVKCTGFKRHERYFTKGKVYVWEDGNITNDNGFTYSRLSGMAKGEDVNEWTLGGWYTFEKVNAELDKILITTDGNVTLARMFEGNKVIKSAEAKCSPHDTFDFAVGANLAYDRLMDRLAAPGEAKPAAIDWSAFMAGEIAVNCRTKEDALSFLAEIERLYSDVRWTTGEKPTEAGAEEWDEYRANTLFDMAHGGRLTYCTIGGYSHSESKLPVAEYRKAAQPAPEPIKLYPEPEYYNGKVVCIKAYEGFTAGKVYCFTDGVCGDNDGDKRPESGRRPIRDLSDGWARDIFIEFKGEAQ